MCWHIDNLNIFHIMPREVTKMIKRIEKTHGKVCTTYIKRYEYLGMMLDYNKPGVLKVDMINYSKASIEFFPEKLEGEVTSLVADHLFDINPGAEKLDEENK